MFTYYINDSQVKQGNAKQDLHCDCRRTKVDFLCGSRVVNRPGVGGYRFGRGERWKDVAADGLMTPPWSVTHLQQGVCDGEIREVCVYQKPSNISLCYMSSSLADDQSVPYL